MEKHLDVTAVVAAGPFLVVFIATENLGQKRLGVDRARVDGLAVGKVLGAGARPMYRRTQPSTRAIPGVSLL